MAGTINPTNDSVTASAIADDAVESEHLNNNIISGQTALAAEPADTDEFLVSDAGTIKRIDYSLIKGQTMVPAFFAYMDGNQSISANTATLVQFDQERLDTSSAYNTSNYLFTPAVAGKYFLFASANIQAVHDQCTNSIIINRNAANDVAQHKVISLNSSSDREPSLAVSTIIDADNSKIPEHCIVL